MLVKIRNPWLRPRVLGVIAAKLILSSATSLAALNVPLKTTEPGAPIAGIRRLVHLNQ